MARFTPGRAGGEDASPLFGVTIPEGYRQWELVAVAHEEGLDELRGVHRQMDKRIWRCADAVREVGHPVQCCFVGLLPVSTMLISHAAPPYSYLVAAGLVSLVASGNGGFPFIALDS